MAFSFLYLALRALLGALVRSRRGLQVKDIELLVLRHELEILRLGRAAGTPDGRSGPACGRGVPPAALVTALALGDSADASALASSARSPQMAAGAKPAWPAQASGGGSGAGVAARAGESALRSPADLWRVGQARLPGVCDQHPPAARRSEARAGAAARRAKLAGVLARAGCEHRRLRFLHRREPLPAPLYALFFIAHGNRRVWLAGCTAKPTGERPPEGEIRRRDRLGGLIHEYHRSAA